MTPIDIAGIIVLICGIVPVVIGLLLFGKKQKKIANAIRVQGRVDHYKTGDQNVFVSSTGEDGTLSREEENMFDGEMVAPVITYETLEGASHSIIGVYSSKPSLKLGASVDVFYQPERPDKAIIDTFFSKWLVVVLLTGIGGILIICGLLVLLIPRLVG